MRNDLVNDSETDKLTISVVDTEDTAVEEATEEAARRRAGATAWETGRMAVFIACCLWLVAKSLLARLLFVPLALLFFEERD
jgi:hypothetical protein